MEYILTTDSLTKKYKKHEALKDVSTDLSARTVPVRQHL